MVKTSKLTETHKDKSIEQIYPETHAQAVFGLGAYISNYMASTSNRMSDGDDLNNLRGIKLYTCDGSDVLNMPYRCDKWFSIQNVEINANTFTQMIVDSKGHMWSRGAGGSNKVWTQWRNIV